ncbi:MAG: hypothetical protein R3D44_04880 [Hyphomicrobiaceae bacterium]
MSLATSGDDEHKRRQRMRSLAIGLALGFLVIVFYVATIVRLGPNALNKGGFGSSPPAVSVPTERAPK